MRLPAATTSTTPANAGGASAPVRRPIAARSLIILGLMLAMTAAAAMMFALLLQTRASRQVAVGWVEHTQVVVNAIDDLLLSADDMEVSQRAFLLTSDASLLPALDHETRDLWHRYARIKDLTADNPRQQATLLTLTDQLSERIAHLNRTLALVMDGKVADAVALVRTGVGRRQMEAIRLTTTSMLSEERRLQMQRNRAADRSGDRTIVIETLLGMLMAAALLLGLVIAVRSLVADAAYRQMSKSAMERQRLLDMVRLAAVMLTDLDGTILFWSDGCHRLFGWTAEQAIGQRSDQLLRSDAATDSGLALLRDGAWSGELRRHHRDGASLLVSVNRVLQTDANVRDRLVVETMTDVTALRVVERRLARSEAQFHSLVDTAADGFVIARADGRIQSVNRAGLALFGYDSEAELFDRNLRVLMTAHDGDRLDEHILAHRAGAAPRVIGVPGRELLAVRRDGSEFPIDMSVSSFGGEGDRYLTGIIRDATGRKQAEAALRDSEARLRLFIDTAPASIAMFDTGMRYLAVSRRFLADLGIACGSPGSLIGLCHYDIIQELPERLHVLHRRVFAGESLSVDEDPFVRADGSIDCLRREMVPWHLADGSVGGLLLFTEDMHDRRRAEAELRETASRLRLVQRVGGIASSARVLAETLASISEEFTELYGLPAGQSELSPEAWGQLLHPDDRARVEQAVETALADGTVLGIEFRIRRPGGDTRWIAMRLQSFLDPEGRPHLISAHQDISLLTASREALEMRRQELEQRVAERTADLAEAEARFRGIFDAQFHFISLLSPDGTTLEMNRTGLDAMLLSREQIIGRKLSETDSWPVAARAQLRLDLEMAADGCHVRREVELRGVEGRPMWIDFSLNPVRDPLTGAVMWLIAECRDLTETRSLAAQLAQAQKVQALGQLAGGIAHDFNNILQAVSGAAALIERTPEDHARTRRYARTALNAATRGLSITQRLLSFARSGELRSRPIPTAAFLHDVQDMLSHTLGTTITVTLDVDAAMPSLLADAAQLETALINLGTNARDAMPDGGTLALSARAEHVGDDSHPAGLAPGDYVRLQIVDDGIGMDARTLERVSEPFFTTKPPGKGTGLGVAMARGFAEQSGGGLVIASTRGRGTDVTLWLRQAEEHAPAGSPPVTGIRASGSRLAGERSVGSADFIGDPPGPDTGRRPSSIGPAAQPDRPDGRAPRILVVDDDELVREVVAAQLEAEGFSTVVAGSGTEALELLRVGEIVDAMISDFSMPVMNGAATIREAMLLRPLLPCILLTGYAGGVTGLHPGGNFALLRKPATGSELGAQIDAMLEGVR
ncbi:PAS domain S-box protein [Lichenicoccus roseus]|uniref:histidine kinase n=1 Tax=Lichenicoccus roseus TaxID=2683649 RepID=A0A5R9JBW0_9PROT|nr:PAS domain S-box protein [Lichenicoccus roseus]TLU74017.1 PAS domain S-box protein [Lichenicoccus roseus]